MQAASSNAASCHRREAWAQDGEAGEDHGSRLLSLHVCLHGGIKTAKLDRVGSR